MKAPEMTLDLENIVSKIINNKVLEIFAHIRGLRKLETFDVEFMAYKQLKLKDGIVTLKVYYKGDLWLKCHQTMTVNGISHIDFESKYIKKEG